MVISDVVVNIEILILRAAKLTAPCIIARRARSLLKLSLWYYLVSAENLTQSVSDPQLPLFRVNLLTSAPDQLDGG